MKLRFHALLKSWMFSLEDCRYGRFFLEFGVIRKDLKADTARSIFILIKVECKL
jgi:hypothetical protein